MKKKLLTRIPMAVMVFFLGKESPAYADLNTGLIAYFPFDGDANDASGNGNGGTVYNAKLTADRFGNENSAYLFNGTNTFITAGSGGSLCFNPSTQSYSVCLWARVDSFSNSRGDLQIICDRDTDNTHVSYSAGVNKVTRRFSNSIWNGATGLSTIAPTPLNASQWYHLAVVVTANSNQIVYVNGVEAAKTSITGLSYLINNTNGIMIGRHYYPDGFQYFNGAMDGVRIYNRALSPSELLELYSQDQLNPVPELYFGITIRDGVPGQAYRIQTATNLVPPLNWETSEIFTQSAAGFLWIDTNSPANAPKKFYRVIP